MAIETTYAQYILGRIIADLIKSGQSPNLATIESNFETETAGKDYTEPQFVSADWQVSRLESASAAKWNNTFSPIKDDLSVLHNEIISLTAAALRSGQRWSTLLAQLEQELIDLENETELLLGLALQRFTDGWLYFIVENFVDMEKVDLALTTADIDLGLGEALLPRASSAQSRIFLNTINTTEDVFFNLQTRGGFIGQAFSEKSDLADPFKQTSKGWWTTVFLNNRRPVTAELNVRLSSSGPVSLSRIAIEMLASNQTTPMIITPLYSTDNATFFQLPSNTYSQSVTDKAIFSFSTVSAQWVKFVLTKQGPDPADFQDRFAYQFGFKEIEFYNASYGSSDKEVISNALSVLDDNVIVPFTKLGLEVCERIDDNTDIDYFFAVSNTADFTVDSSTEWYPITPSNRAEGSHPRILVVGNIASHTVGETETVTVAYDGVSGSQVNPADDFQLLSLNTTDNSLYDEAVTAASNRYLFQNLEDRILNYQIKDIDYTGSGTGTALEIDKDNLVVFRNVGEQGLSPETYDNNVRKILRGWRFEDPYYITVVEIRNPDGITMDVGPEPIIIDDISYTNKVPKTVLTGKTAATTGIHTIKVHKTNWIHVAAGLTTTNLKLNDPLYPYNHRFLVEGYQYSSSNSGTELYTGVDLFAAQKMTKVSQFDLIKNVAFNDYAKFALDRDLPGTHPGGNTSGTAVFLLKVDDTNPDFVNERFVIRFNVVREARQYLRVRALLSTSDTGLTPSLDSYRVKLA